MHVRVNQALHLPASPAPATGLLAALLTEEQLGQPQGQALLADPRLTDEDQDLWEPIGSHRAS
jgi:hypothetical protein